MLSGMMKKARIVPLKGVIIKHTILIDEKSTKLTEHLAQRRAMQPSLAI
jgi:hypothetical protein